MRAGRQQALDHLDARAGNLEVVRAKIRVMEQIQIVDQIEDMLITLGGQYHLIRPLESHPSMFGTGSV